MAEGILTKVPESLKKLVRVTGRAFYPPLHVVCLDVLTKYPCVTLSDLVEVLKMHGSQKQLQQALNSLHKDKLVKWLQKMEVPVDQREAAEKKDETKRVAPKLTHYYYINYKLFVNVVKYKLDQMRKRLESNSNMAQNRVSYKCSRCDSTYSDLDVKILFDPRDGALRCSYCRETLEEDKPEADEVDTRALVSRLNEYAKPITDLLRETENLNLAPELLEPEAQSIQKYLQSKGTGRRPSSTREATWSTQAARDIYGDSTEVSVNIGDGSQQSSKTAAKERPEWLVRSTVHTSADSQVSGSSVDTLSTESSSQLSKRHKKEMSETDRQIMEDLMAHETKSSSSSSVPSSFPLSSLSMPSSYPDDSEERAQYSSSYSSGDEEEAEGGNVGGASSVSYMGAGGGSGFEEVEEFEESSDEEEFTVRVGENVVPVTEVTDKMVVNMTEEEKRRYKMVYQKLFSQTDDF